ncbi:MAG: sensor domain-containing diguanylate cyclase, partial [Lachnospiraceae bacterium]|nr:sensor domain-containing diguanylate cyclase [Lachnospiraceae bacterium]
MIAEDELKLARERFNVIFQNTTVSVWDYIFETRQIIQPVRSQELHGFEEIVEDVPDSLIESGYVHPESAEAFRQMYDRMFAGEPHVEGIFRVQTADRNGYWYEHIRYNVLTDENGMSYAAVGMSTDVTKEVELQKKADSDPITGLLNHRAFSEQAEMILNQKGDYAPFMVLIDLDRFKSINDNFGHAVGDQMLCYTGSCIADIIKANGQKAIIARAGGDEFAILFYDCEKKQVEKFAEELLERLARPSLEEIRLSASIGIASFPKDGETFEKLGEAADRILYYVKRHGKRN